MKTRNMQILYKLFMMLVLAMVVSCGTNGSQSASTGDITAKLAWNPSEKTTAKTVASAPAGVTTVRIIISGADMTTILKDFTAASGSGTIDGVLPGTARTLTAQGLDGTGAVIYQGTAANLTVQAGQTTNAGIITMAAVGAKPTVTGFSPASAASGTVVTISGTNFSTTPTNNTVKFYGTPASVTAATATSLTVTVPSGTTTGTVSVTTVGGTATSADSFTVTIPTAAAPVGKQMGGARQGTPLVLTTDVTVLAGTVNQEVLKDGIGTEATFGSPNRLATDGTNLFITDGTTIRNIVLATRVVTTLAGLANNPGSVDGIGAAARFMYVSSITTDGTNLYVVDNNKIIRKIVIATGEVTSFIGTGKTYLYPHDGTDTGATFSGMGYITTDGTNLYVTEGSSIRKIVIASKVVTTLVPTYNYTKTIGTDGTSGITTDGTNLYTSDSGNNIIRKVVISTGAVTTLAGPSSAACNALPWCPTGSAEGTGSEALFNRPRGITTDGTNLYVADSGNKKFRKIVIATGVVTTLVGGGGPGLSLGGDFSASPALFFDTPTDITTDGTSLYLTTGRPWIQIMH